MGAGGLRDAEFAEFFRAEHKRLIRFVMAMGAGGDEAAEIAQLTFVKAFESWCTIRAPRAWIRRVAVNELAVARQAARRETPQATLPDTPGPAMYGGTAAALAIGAIAGLYPATRAVH